MPQAHLKHLQLTAHGKCTRFEMFYAATHIAKCGHAHPTNSLVCRERCEQEIKKKGPKWSHGPVAVHSFQKLYLITTMEVLPVRMQLESPMPSDKKKRFLRILKNLHFWEIFTNIRKGESITFGFCAYMPIFLLKNLPTLSLNKYRIRHSCHHHKVMTSSHVTTTGGPCINEPTPEDHLHGLKI